MSVLGLNDVKAHLNISATTTDGEIQSMIEAAEAAIARRVGPLEPTIVTTTVSGSGAVTLPVYPVLSLTTITDAVGTSIPLMGVTVDLAAGVVSGSSGDGLGSSTYTITYSAGRMTVPADLKLAVKELVRHLWTTQRNPAIFPGSSLTDGPESQPGAGYLMPYRVQELIAPHVQFGFA